MNYRQQKSLKEASLRSLNHNKKSKVEESIESILSSEEFSNLSEEDRHIIEEQMKKMTSNQGTYGMVLNDINEGFIAEEGATPENMSENDEMWWSRYYYTYIAMKFYPDNPSALGYSDYNGDGVVDFNDILIILSMWAEDLPFMNPEQYQAYMDSDARSGKKQQRGSQLQIGTKFGSKTSRPPVVPDTTGGRPPQGGGGAPNGPYPPFPPAGGPSPI